jgi:hypothetical protein
MPNLDAFLNGTSASFNTNRIIARDPVELVLVRGNTPLAAQTVRVVPAGARGSRRTMTDANNMASSIEVVVIGADDLDIQKDDVFMFRGTRHVVQFVNNAYPGQVQARAVGKQ